LVVVGYVPTYCLRNKRACARTRIPLATLFIKRMGLLGENIALCLLALCWAATLSASALSFTVAPLAAKNLGISDSLAPFTNSLFLIGMALIAALSVFLFDKCGRRLGFAGGAAIGALGGAVGVIGVLQKSSDLIFVSSFFVGVAQGLAQFYRFAALELTTPERRPVAVGLVLSGGFVAAFAGPSLTPATESFGANYLGSFGAIVVLHILNGVLSLSVSLGKPEVSKPRSDSNSDDAKASICDVDRSNSSNGGFADTSLSSESLLRNSRDRQLSSECCVFSEEDQNKLVLLDKDLGKGNNTVGEALPRTQSLFHLLMQPACVVAVLVAMLGQGVMVGLMSPLGLEMTAHDIPDHLITLTFELHIASMYGPGLFTGKLLQRIGPLNASSIGMVLLLAACAVLRVAATSLVPAHFTIGMMLCGLGWNLCFSSGTLMLAACHDPQDATRMQAANDALVFGFSAIGTLGSGEVYASSKTMGWATLTYCAAGLSACILPLLLAGYRFTPSDVDDNGRVTSGIGSSNLRFKKASQDFYRF
jgi:MFS family permease